MTDTNEIPQVMALNRDQLSAIRAIRLFHWMERGKWRRVSQGTKDAKFAEVADRYARWHIAAVEALDVFFPDQGDSAEADQEKAKQQ